MEIKRENDCGINSLIVLLIQRMEMTATKMKIEIINSRINGFICNACYNLLLDKFQIISRKKIERQYKLSCKWND